MITLDARVYHDDIKATLKVKKNTNYTAWYDTMTGGDSRINFGKKGFTRNGLGLPAVLIKSHLHSIQVTLVRLMYGELMMQE